jgi:hypothetical protein
MTLNKLLIDFENVQMVDLAQLDESFQITIFVGANQTRIPIELVASAQKLGNRIDWQCVDAHGRNALDFFIACELGRLLEKSPQMHCFVLSKDKGFDPLLRQLNKAGLKCKRLDNLLDIASKATPPEEPYYKRVVELLGKSEKNSRPRKRKTLSQHISSMFQKKIKQSEIDLIVDRLFSSKLISETNNTITYEF